ncbi:chemokine XC receptor 1-like [Anoplopoma fimbria]|uniref:chemokine XC receptor 1-like n=1 Tax=Anoplopoma fimbria TaxID=229290 RepID=UPI0023EE2537|nr:chemokine XC receptor 1-like [Anoplopoma fimbria]
MATTDSTFNPTTENDSYYDYSDEPEDEMCDKTSVIHFGAIVTPVLFSIMVILSLFGNVLVIVILAKYENVKSLTNAFILNLAVSDLFFTAGLPFWAYNHVHGWTLGEHTCKVVSFVFYVGFYSSGILLILMTAHRYVAVMNPLSDIVSTTGSRSIVACVIVWAVSTLVASPAFIFTKVDQNRCVQANSYWNLWGIYQQNIFFILSSVVFIFCYSQIMCRLLRPSAQRRKNKTLKLIFTLTVVFFVGWAPYNTVIFLKSLDSMEQPLANSKTLVGMCKASQLLDYAFYISRLLAFSHCYLNPVFYVFVGVKFKNHLKKMLKGWGHRNSSLRNRHSRLTITSVTSGEELSM